MLDVHGADSVGKYLVQHAGDMPAWIWLEWVPQLVVGLQRPESPAAKRLLAAAAIQHPQYVYWYIRPAINHLRDAAMKALKDTNKSNPQKSNDSSKEKSTPDTKSRPKRSSQKEKVAAQEKDSDEEMPDAPSETPGGPVDQSGVENTPGGGPVANPGMEKPAEVSFLTCLI